MDDLQKIQLAQKVFHNRKSILSLAQEIHGIPVQWNLPHPELYDFLVKRFGEIKTATNPIEVDVHLSHKLDNEILWKDSNPDCRFYKRDSAEWVVQRDFVAKVEGSRLTTTFNPDTVDGTSNLLRWLLPMKMLDTHRLLLHSSCIIDQNQRAHLFLGPSGAGKTTISSLFPRQLVLGDDMNVLFFGGKEVFVTPSLLGQGIENIELAGQMFPIHKIYFLEKGPTLKLDPIKKTKCWQIYFTSLANLFWNQLSELHFRLAQERVTELLEKFPIELLSFYPNEEVPNHVLSI